MAANLGGAISSFAQFLWTGETSSYPALAQPSRRRVQRVSPEPPADADSDADERAAADAAAAAADAAQDAAEAAAAAAEAASAASLSLIHI